MAVRTASTQTSHDTVVDTIRTIYVQHSKHAVTNPDGKKNEDFNGRYIDVIARENATVKSAWLIEVETADSVSESEAKSQWEDYASVYTTRWYLAVPKEKQKAATDLLSKHKITNCTVVTWWTDEKGVLTFAGLPGI